MPKLRRRRRDPQGTMSIWEHLAEVRARLVRCLIYVAAGFVVSFVFLYNPVLAIISHPFEQALGVQHLVTNGLVETVAIKLKMSTYLAICIAMPLVVWEVWRFIAPGLTAKEKHWSRPFVPLVFVFFALGVVVGYLTLKPAVGFMVHFAGPNIQAIPFANQYLTLFTFMMLAFGITFEFPLVLILLEAARVVNYRQLLSVWRYAVVGIVIFAAVITPSQDPYSLFLMAVPMCVFYFGAALFGRFAFRKRDAAADRAVDDSEVAA